MTEWEAEQDRLAARAVALGAQRSREIWRRLEGAGVSPEQVDGVAGLGSVPVLPKDDLPSLQAADPPFGGMLAVPVGSLRRVFRSPGPIMDPEGDFPDFWRVAPAAQAAGFRHGDVVLNALSYHLTPGGLMLDGGLRAVGCVVVPGGVSDAAAQIEAARAAGATGYVGTPQFLLAMLARAAEAGAPLSIRRALVTGAPLPPDLRDRLQRGFDVDVYQSYGTADAGTLGYECEAKDGWHVAPEVVVELLSPRDGRPVGDDGAPGEVVVTSPNEVYPLVRFGTGDLSAWNRTPCRCGRASPRLAGFLGRVGEGVKVRGMFVHPRELSAALDAEPSVARFAAIVAEAGGRDVLTVRVELASGREPGTGSSPALGAQPYPGSGPAPARQSDSASGPAPSRQSESASRAAPGGEPDPTRLARIIREAVKVRAEVVVVPAGSIPDDARPLSDERG